MMGTKTALKYGGPTDSLPRLSASITMGYTVPSSTAAAPASSRTLLMSSKVSRETSAKLPPCPTAGARQAKRVSEPPTTIARKTRMKTPRVGSAAKAWTEVSTPERTMKVPSSDNENAEIAKSTVQFLKLPRFSETARE